MNIINGTRYKYKKGGSTWTIKNYDFINEGVNLLLKKNDSILEVFIGWDDFKNDWVLAEENNIDFLKELEKL